MNLKALITGTCTAAILTYNFFPSDNLARHCKNPEQFEDRNLCFISDFAPEIKEQAQQHNLPPELIAAILYQENDCRLRLQDTADYISAKIGRFHSAGPAQIYTSTAARLDKIGAIILSDVDAYYERLNIPQEAISFAAQELAYLQQMTAVNAFSLQGIDILATEYRTGHQQTLQINNHGYDVLIILRRPDIYNALGIKVPKGNRQRIQDHLNRTKKERIK